MNNDTPSTSNAYYRLVPCLIIIIVLLSVATHLVEQRRRTEERETMWSMSFHQTFMGFHYNLGFSAYMPSYISGNPDKTLVFVSSREDIDDTLSNVVFAFPSNRTIIQLYEMNFFLTNRDELEVYLDRAVAHGFSRDGFLDLWERNRNRMDEIDLNDFSLSYPITMHDMVYNWENVSNLFGEMLFLIDADFGTRAMHIHIWLIDKELEAMNAEIERLGFTDLDLDFDFPIIREGRSRNAAAIRAFYHTYLEGIIHAPIFFEELTWWDEFR